MIAARRNSFLRVFTAGLLLGLASGPGCCKRCCRTGEKSAWADNAGANGSVGVTVTAPVPHAATSGAAPDNGAAAPSPPSIPRAIPIGKKPPPAVIPSAEEPQ